MSNVDRHAPPEALQARVEHEGAVYALTLLISIYSNEGSALLERVPDDARDVAYFVQNGEWRIKSHDDGPTTLSVDFDDSGDIEHHAVLLDKLMAALAETGMWSIEGFQPQSEALS